MADAQGHRAGAGAGVPGIGVDSFGNSTIDPTKNVLDLVNAQANFQAKIDEMSQAARKAETDWIVKHFEALMVAERRRLDDLAEQKKDYDKQISETMSLALSGQDSGPVHEASERQPLEIVLRLARHQRSSLADLETLRVRAIDGSLIPLSELGTASSEATNMTIYHKNLRRLNYVIAEMVGREPVEAVLDWGDIQNKSPLADGYSVDLAGEGEWKITVDVFRDLGLAFGAALLMIYVLLVAQTGSLGMPLIIMVAIPLTVIGIMPGFWLLNLLFTTPIAGVENPILFTATAMIGMIALAGIVVRNSIILIDFIQRLRAQGHGLEDALIEAGATRMRPIFLTAGAALFGSFIITLDPIFSGLAWSFIFGIFASTAFSLYVVPVVYFLLNRDQTERPNTQ